MPSITFKAILGAAEIWLLLAAIFLGSILVGAAHGPWNYYWFFTMVCWAVLDIYWALAARDVKPAVAVRQNRLKLLAGMLILALYCLPLSSIPLLGQRVMPRFAAVEILGAFMCAFGVGFAMWARHVLARDWNAAVTLREGHTLVQDGPYTMVRHPIYFGFLVAAVGMVLVLGEVRALVLLFGVEILLKKMGHEESILRATFPDEYPTYERRVKKLLPRIW
jgi:protein-S-isoprenylcysteine O-methyltransferase Ste14